jgi:hypothetical protein
MKWLAPSFPTGGLVGLELGVAESTNNAFGLNFGYVGSGSTSNNVAFGFYGSNTMLLYPDHATLTNGTSQQAICLADGTGGGVCGGGVTPITGTVTLTPVTNTTSVSCASTTCTNVRGVLTIVQSGTNGEVNVSWPTTTTAQICSVASNDGSQLNGYYTDVATAIGVNIFFYTAGIGTIHPMYSCQK